MQISMALLLNNVVGGAIEGSFVECKRKICRRRRDLISRVATASPMGEATEWKAALNDQPIRALQQHVASPLEKLPEGLMRSFF
jgi:hypothetical protein